MDGMASTGEPWRLGRRPGLDGLRGIAILLVLVCHVLDNAGIWNGAGSAGVTVFFTLSGFLITSLLVEELQARGRVSLRSFYARRARRLFPALAAAVLLVGAFQAAVGIASPGHLLPVIFYVGNWIAVAHGNLGLLPHTWSLSIEEQFYLLWPLGLLAVWRWRNGPVLLASLGILASMAARFALAGDWYRVYYGSDTRADGLLVGCLLALLAHRGLSWRPSVVTATAGMMALAAVSLGGASLSARGVWIPALVPWITAAMIWTACSSQSPRWLAADWLRYIGRRSYGIYLWHYPFVLLVGYFSHSLGVTLLAVMASVGIAEASWRFVEAPFLGGGRRGEQIPVRAVREVELGRPG